MTSLEAVRSGIDLRTTIGLGWLVVACAAMAVGCNDEGGGTADDSPQGPDARRETDVDVNGDTEPDGPAADSSTETAPIAIRAGALTVELDPMSGELIVRRDTTRLLRFDSASFQLGILPEVTDDVHYDPYLALGGRTLGQLPQGLNWLEPVSMSVIAVSDDATTLELGLDYGADRTATVSLQALADGQIRGRWAPGEIGGSTAFLRLRPQAGANEAFYGLGEWFDHVDHRGFVRAMQLEIEPGVESNYNEAHVPVPFVIGTRGWGLFIESPFPGAFAIATKSDPPEARDRIDAAFGTGLWSSEGLRFYLFAAEHPLDVTRHYYEITGYPRLPAQWALGPWVWRDENDDQAQVERDVEIMRELDLAASGYWIDRPYARAVNSFDFEPDQFPDPSAMVRRVQDLGFRLALWHTPYIDDTHEATAELRAHAEAQGFYPPQSGLIANPWGRLVDLTNPQAYAWWQTLLTDYIEMGVEGFKLDYAEDVIAGVGQARNVWNFADGSDERTMHSQFQRWYHRVYAELLPDAGGFLLCRAGTYGDQTHGVIIWPGDLDASFAERGDRVQTRSGETYRSVGGLPASVIGGLGLGPSGFPFYGADTGGYLNAPPDKELFIRWFQQTALSTVMQIGTNANDVAWELGGENGFDQAMLDLYRIYVRLHLRLFPYEWTLAERLLEDGRPIQRPYGLARPELGIHPWDTYFFGDDLLVAPVLIRDQRAREVPFPPGRWIDWWTGEVIDGGRTLEVSAPIEKLPLYLREGAIVPLLRPTIDTLAPTRVPDQVDAYATTPGVLFPRIVAPASDAEHRFVLFDGTELAQSRSGNTLALNLSSGQAFRHGFAVELLAVSHEPRALTVDGDPVSPSADRDALDAEPVGWWADPETSAVWIRVPAGDHEVRIEIE